MDENFDNDLKYDLAIEDNAYKIANLLKLGYSIESEEVKELIIKRNNIYSGNLD